MTGYCLEGGTRHSWIGTGLDVVVDVLCRTRRCVGCERREVATYGKRRRPRWRVVA